MSIISWSKFHDLSGLQIRESNWKLIFLFLNQNICCGYSKEPSQWDGSFELTKQMLILMGKKIFTILRSEYLFIWSYDAAMISFFRLIWTFCHKFKLVIFKRKFVMRLFSYPSGYTYVLGTQKNCLIETVLLSNHNIFLRNKYHYF